ncbi:NnrU family protein, partial [Rhizobium johnstonii]
MTLLIVGIILFLVVHLVRVLWPDFRHSMIASLGEKGWRAAYSI